MNKKHLLGAIGGFAVATLLTSKIVFAGCINYRLQAPATGEVRSGRVVKKTSGNYARNVVTYFGWKGTEIRSWIYCPDYKRDLSDCVKFHDIGDFNMYYNDSNKYNACGKQVQLKFKTNLTTFHACDIKGTFLPDGR